MLPDPDTVARDSAYVIEDGTGQWLYFITGLGTEASPLIWDRVAFENGTTVLVGGNPVQTFDADTKIDKVSNANRIYGTDNNGNQTAYTVSQGQSAYTMARRGVDGILNVGTPTSNNHATTKAYVDEQVQGAKDASVEKNTTQEWIVYGTSSIGTQTSHMIATTNARRVSGSIPSYSSLTNTNADTIPTNATLIVSTPTKVAQAANKKYVDDKIGSLQIKTINSKIVIGKTSIPLTDYILSGVPAIIEITPIYSAASQYGNIGIGYTSSSDKYVKIKVFDLGTSSKTAMCYKSDGTIAMVSVGPYLYVGSGISAVAFEYSPATQVTS